MTKSPRYTTEQIEYVAMALTNAYCEAAGLGIPYTTLSQWRSVSGYDKFMAQARRTLNLKDPSMEENELSHHNHDREIASAARVALAECQRQLALLAPYNAALLELLDNARKTLGIIRESL